MRVRKPDWHYQACPGSVLITSFDWRTGARLTMAATDLYYATHLIVNLMVDEPDLAYVIVDGFGEFVYGRSAPDAPPDETFYVGTRQVYDLWLELAAHFGDDALAMSTMQQFTDIADYMGVQLT